MPVIFNDRVPVGKWDGKLVPQYRGQGLEVYSAKIRGISHDNVVIGEHSRVNVHVIVVDQSFVNFRPFVDNEVLIGAGKVTHKSVEAFKRRCREKETQTGEKLLAWCDGFNDVGFNRGHWAWFEGHMVQHNPHLMDRDMENPFSLPIRTVKKEKLSGIQTALIKKRGEPYPTIGIIDIDRIPNDVEWVFGSPRIIRPGGEVVNDLLSIDPDTGRPLFVELIGDIRHVLKLPQRGDLTEFPVSAYLTALTLHESVDGVTRISPDESCRKDIAAALEGRTLQIKIDQRHKSEVKKALEAQDPLAGYEHVNNILSLRPGQFSLYGSSLYIRLRRSTYNHSAICTVKGRPELLILYKEIDEGYEEGGRLLPTRKGFTVEDTSNILRALCAVPTLGYQVDQALVTAEGGDPSIHVPGYFDDESYRKIDGTKVNRFGLASMFGIHSTGKLM